MRPSALQSRPIGSRSRATGISLSSPAPVLFLDAIEKGDASGCPTVERAR
jgi:hypothetical protein